MPPSAVPRFPSRPVPHAPEGTSCIEVAVVPRSPQHAQRVDDRGSVLSGAACFAPRASAAAEPVGDIADAVRGGHRRNRRPGGHGIGRIAACLALGLALAATARADDPQTPPSGIARWFDPDTAPFLPIPEIDTSPFSGLTVGLLPVMLSNNADGQIDRINAPDIFHTQYFGWGARWRTFRNPSDDEKWSVIGGLKERTESEFDAEYDLGLLRATRWSWTAHLMYDRSGTGRFFGLGNDTTRFGATNYVDTQSRAELTVARNFGPMLQLAYTARLSAVEIEPGVLRELPSIERYYPNLPGLGETHELQQRVVLGYDTRDAPTIPRQGVRVAAFAGISRSGLVSSASYSFVGIDASLYQPISRTVTLALHGAWRVMPSYAAAPFWALSSVGGDRSVVAEDQPLRAYGERRFTDRNAFSSTVELRLRTLTMHLFATDLYVEPAPFLDLGKVYTRMSGSPLAHPHFAGGIGFRIVASPFIVGYVDLGYGKSGLVVFSGINYPF